MKIKTVKDYVDQVHQKFPELQKEEINKILEEHLIFIREFSLLIKKKSKEENIKTYSEIILKNVKDLGDKLE